MGLSIDVMEGGWGHRSSPKVLLSHARGGKLLFLAVTVTR